MKLIPLLIVYIVKFSLGIAYENIIKKRKSADRGKFLTHFWKYKLKVIRDNALVSTNDFKTY